MILPSFAYFHAYPVATVQSSWNILVKWFSPLCILRDAILSDIERHRSVFSSLQTCVILTMRFRSISLAIALPHAAGISHTHTNPTALNTCAAL